MTCTIRPAGPGDLVAIQDLLRATWHQTYDGIYGVERVAELTTAWHALPKLEAELGRGDHLLAVVLESERVVATASATVGGPGRLRLDRLYVRPPAQGRGHGRALLDAVLATYPDANEVEAEVERRNEAALGFYRRMGFTWADGALAEGPVRAILRR